MQHEVAEMVQTGPVCPPSGFSQCMHLTQLRHKSLVDVDAQENGKKGTRDRKATCSSSAERSREMEH